MLTPVFELMVSCEANLAKIERGSIAPVSRKDQIIMTPKQRFKDALNHKQPSNYVSFMEIEFHIYKEFIGREPIVGYEFEKLSSSEKEKAFDHNAEVFIETAEKAGHDAIKDIGGFWEISPGKSAYLWLPDEKSRIDQVSAIKRAAGDKYFIISTSSGTMGIPDGEHLYEFVIDLYDNPEDVKERNEKSLLNGIALQNKLLDAGADGILNACDVAFNSGPFISPQLMDEFFFPYFNRWVDSLKSQGIPSIWHTDGNIMPIMDRTLESGVTAIQCVDPLGGMDIVKLKKQVGNRLALIGNLDCSLLQTGPAEIIEAETKKIIEGCNGSGGFVLCGCNAIFQGISVENYMVFVNSRYKYGSTL